MKWYLIVRHPSQTNLKQVQVIPSPRLSSIGIRSDLVDDVEHRAVGPRRSKIRVGRRAEIVRSTEVVIDIPSHSPRIRYGHAPLVQSQLLKWKATRSCVEHAFVTVSCTHGMHMIFASIAYGIENGSGRSIQSITHDLVTIKGYLGCPESTYVVAIVVPTHRENGVSNVAAILGT